MRPSTHLIEGVAARLHRRNAPLRRGPARAERVLAALIADLPAGTVLVVVDHLGEGSTEHTTVKV